MDTEDKELVNGPRNTDNFSSSYVETFGNDPLLVDAETIAASRWQDMVDETQIDGRGRGIVVSRTGSGKLITSRVFTGLAEKLDYDDPTSKTPTSFSAPFLPHGLRSLIPGTRDILVVHTHPMPPELDHIQTTMFSDTDVRTFMSADYKAIVMVDRGGAHLLVRTRPPLSNGPQLARNIVNETIERVKEEQGGSMDVLKSLAVQLSGYGIGYFYSPQLHPEKTEGFIKFQRP